MRDDGEKEEKKDREGKRMCGGELVGHTYLSSKNMMNRTLNEG